MNNIEDNERKNRIIKLATGAAVLAAAMVLEKVWKYDYNVPLVFFIASYFILGGDVIRRALRNIAEGRVFDENFLMSVATIGAFYIGETAESTGVMLFYQIGEFFQDMAVEKSKRSIAELMNIRPDYANLVKGGDIEKVAPDIVRTGDIIIVKPGEKIPLDGVVIEGVSMLDASALTGESVPRKAGVKDIVLSGCVNQTGVLKIEVTKIFGESTVSKIINLVENASSKKAKTENFITTFARYYTPAVVALAVLIAVLPPLFGGVWQDWLKRALIFLVISCPCALVLSIPMGFFAGIGSAAKRGILIKGGSYLEAFNNLEIAVFDKTGTLTKGVFKVTDVQNADGFSKDELLELAVCAEVFSNHPIALSVINEYKNQRSGVEANRDGLSQYMEHSGYGISVIKDGKTILAGNSKLMEKNGVVYTESENTGTKVYVACDGIFAGSIVISDEIKPDSRSALDALRKKGVKTVMLTGDNQDIARNIADELGIDEVYGGLLPHQKVEKLEELNARKKEKGKLTFVGDGINDAPVLAMADIGVVMGGIGSDAAIEAGDVVLMNDEPSKLIEFMNIAKFTKRVVLQNIVFVLAVKAVFLLLGALGLAQMWEAVFADVGTALLAVLNSMRIQNTIRVTNWSISTSIPTDAV
jgi:Cd2+/Zn2+-exporting ATPase